MLVLTFVVLGEEEDQSIKKLHKQLYNYKYDIPEEVLLTPKTHVVQSQNV
jgi:hypothetical protein